MIRGGGLQAGEPLGDVVFESAVLAVAGIFYAAAAYQPWGWPSVDGYPAIERFVDPGFLTNDFYVNTTADYNVDTLLAGGLGWIQKTTGVRYDVVLALLNLARCLLWPFVLFQFLRAMSSDRRIALIGALIGAASVFAIPDLFAWGWLWGDPSTAMFAVLIITGAWTLFLDRKPALAMLAFTAALLAHPLMAVHGAVFAILIYLLDYARSEKLTALRSPAAWAGVLLFAGVFTAQYALLSGAPDAKAPTATYTQVLAYTRHPTDFIPSLFPLDDWIAGVLSMAAAGFILWKRRADFRRWRLVIGGLVAYAFIGVCGYLFVELHPVRFFVELIPFRHVIVAAPLMLLAFATLAASDLSEGRQASFMLLAALFLAHPVARATADASLFVLALLAIWIGVRLTSGAGDFRTIDRLFGRRAPPRLLVTGFAVVLLAAAPGAAYMRRDELAIPRAENQHPLYAWAAANTAKDAVFLLDQNGARAFSAALDPQRMRLVGRRAVVASKDFPFLDRDIIPWSERWRVALGNGAPRFVSKADGGVLAEIAARFAYDYVVRDEPLADSRFSLARTFNPAKGAPTIYVYALNRVY